MTLSIDDIRKEIGLTEESMNKQASSSFIDPVALEIMEYLEEEPETLSSRLQKESGINVPPQVLAFIKSAEAVGYSEDEILNELEKRLGK